jgi:hypothetical protein
MQRSLAYLRSKGYWAEPVEHFVTVATMPGGGFKRDVFHCVDIEALGVGHVLYVQTTTVGCMSEHITKIQGLPEFERIKRAAPGLRFELHGWDESRRGGGLQIVDAMTLETILDDRVMAGRRRRTRLCHQGQLL